MRRALTGAAVFDGEVLLEGAALLLNGDDFAGTVPEGRIPAGFDAVDLGGGTLCPGFVDLQVNGGGGVMFNDDPSVNTLVRILAAHHRLGTRWLLPTLITDTPERTRAAVAAVAAGISDGLPGLLGLHLEGPHLSLARRGAHDPHLIRPMSEADAAFLCDGAARLPNLMVTLAPESVSPTQISRLRSAGIIVALGHSGCDFETAMAAIAAGATCVTHLFNAMSQLGSRAPGLVGAALSSGGVSAGLIADGIHVHPAVMGAALAAKTGPGRIFLVTDAMAPAGSEITEFALNGRRVLRRDARLTLEDGTLAGAQLDMPMALRVLVGDVGVHLATALAMSTSGPAAVLRRTLGAGRFTVGAPWNGIHLDDDLNLSALILPP